VRILVTGGAGYIGSHTANHLQARGDDVVVLDSLVKGHRAAIGGLPLIVGDIRDAELIESCVRQHRIETVVHFAALKSVEASVCDPFGYFDVNVGGTMTLARAAIAGGVQRLVFSSSCAVYGQPDRLPVDERGELAPENPYGETKLAAERLLRSLETATGLRTVALRYFNAAGAADDGSTGEDWLGATNLIPSVLRVAAGQDAALSVFGTNFPTPDGTAIRDYVHVLDLAEAHALALDHLAAGGRSIAVNIGTGRGSSVREVIATAESVVGRPIPVIEEDRRQGDPPAVWADARLASELLGWTAQRDLRAILESAWSWHQSHPRGYRPVGADA
jgi:UDP-glucose-4-epimerase GalE